jgi:hypothetical protein
MLWKSPLHHLPLPLLPSPRPCPSAATDTLSDAVVQTVLQWDRPRFLLLQDRQGSPEYRKIFWGRAPAPHRTHTNSRSGAPHLDDTPAFEGLAGTLQKHKACSSLEHTPPPPLPCSHYIPYPLHSLPHCSPPHSDALNPWHTTYASHRVPAHSTSSPSLFHRYRQSQWPARGVHSNPLTSHRLRSSALQIPRPTLATNAS